MSCIGLDIGTSGVKGLLLSEDQRILAEADSPLTVSNPQPGWSEQDPNSWVTAVYATLHALKRAAPEAFIATTAIGLSGQMHGATLLGADDAPLRPCILWNDGRSGPECRDLTGAADFHGIGGNLVMPGFTAPKLLWVHRHEPEVFNQTKTVLLPKDYVRLHLTGEKLSDMSDSAGTLWLDVAGRRWSPELLAACSLDVDAMPGLVEGNARAGTLRPHIVEEFGFTQAPILAGGGGDNAAAACGIGAVSPGTGFLSLGTSGVIFVGNDRFRPNVAGAVHAFAHAVPDTWHQMAVILAATDSLNWLVKITGASAADLATEAGTADPLPPELVFLPFLSGERTPHNNPDLRGRFVGLSTATSRGQLARAVLNGVACAFADGMDALKAAGTEVASLMLIGGGSRSDLWAQVLADLLDVRLQRPNAGHLGGAFGAARLALSAVRGEAPERICTPPTVESEFVPDPSNRSWAADLRGGYADQVAAALLAGDVPN